jgi:hypothetical protein
MRMPFSSAFSPLLPSLRADVFGHFLTLLVASLLLHTASAVQYVFRFITIEYLALQDYPKQQQCTIEAEAKGRGAHG